MKLLLGLIIASCVQVSIGAWQPGKQNAHKEATADELKPGHVRKKADEADEADEVDEVDMADPEAAGQGQAHSHLRKGTHIRKQVLDGILANHTAAARVSNTSTPRHPEEDEEEADYLDDAGSLGEDSDLREGHSTFFFSRRRRTWTSTPTTTRPCDPPQISSINGGKYYTCSGTCSKMCMGIVAATSRTRAAANAYCAAKACSSNSHLFVNAITTTASSSSCVCSCSTSSLTLPVNTKVGQSSYYACTGTCSRMCMGTVPASGSTPASAFAYCVAGFCLGADVMVFENPNA